MAASTTQILDGGLESFPVTLFTNFCTYHATGILDQQDAGRSQTG